MDAGPSSGRAQGQRTRRDLETPAQTETRKDEDSAIHHDRTVILYEMGSNRNDGKSSTTLKRHMPQATDDSKHPADGISRTSNDAEFPH
ncbi:hypothetical protein VTN49DRAFT_4007 [Thermomyces lanuginosus]|uniref:uncharacterized protein n=1 Tax=Thermomyces lanuginosus TaxID=5541 RepID=UPI0037438465